MAQAVVRRQAGDECLLARGLDAAGVDQATGRDAHRRAVGVAHRGHLAQRAADRADTREIVAVAQRGDDVGRARPHEAGLRAGVGPVEQAAHPGFVIKATLCRDQRTGQVVHLARVVGHLGAAAVVGAGEGVGRRLDEAHHQAAVGLLDFGDGPLFGRGAEGVAHAGQAQRCEDAVLQCRGHREGSPGVGAVAPVGFS